MLWIAFAWAVSLIVAYAFGYHMRGLKKHIERLEEVIQSKADKPVTDPEPKSEFIDK